MIKLNDRGFISREEIKKEVLRRKAKAKAKARTKRSIINIDNTIFYP